MLQEFPVHDEYHCANDVKVNAKARPFSLQVYYLRYMAA